MSSQQQRTQQRVKPERILIVECATKPTRHLVDNLACILCTSFPQVVFQNHVCGEKPRQEDKEEMIALLFIVQVPTDQGST